MYQRFLLQYDGARLYRDETFGQWGFHLYGTSELASANARWKQRYGQEWSVSYLAFAESLGDGDLLILDLAQPNKAGTDCRVIDGDSGYQPREWKAAARGFSDWLDHLVAAQARNTGAGPDRFYHASAHTLVAPETLPYAATCPPLLG